MRRASPPLHLFAVAGSSSTAAAAATPPLMSTQNSFQAGRGWGRGRKSYSHSPAGKSEDLPAQFVTGDSHYRQVQDANRGIRPSYNSGNFSHYQSSQSFIPRPKFYNPPPQQEPFSKPYGPSLRPLPSQHQYINQTHQPFRQPPPHYGSNQQFRAQWHHHQQQQQQQQQQFKPRPPKEFTFRNWEYAKPGLPPECERFTVLSYNILADYLARDHQQKLYFHIPRYMMDWEWRKRRIVFEIGLWSADILCIQEVDRFEDLKEELGHQGYTGIWKMRTGDPVDGCAIFWRDSRFKLLHEESIEYNTLGLRDNVAQICVFQSLYQSNGGNAAVPAQSLRKGNKVVVCNIHVLFNPKRGEIKLGQVRVLLNRAYTVSKLWDDAPVIVCGDFNSTPKSPLYNFIAEQKLDLSELPRNQVSGQASAEIHPPRPSYPKPEVQSADNLPQVLSPTIHTRTESHDSPVSIHTDESFGDETYGDTSLSVSFSPVLEKAVEPCIALKGVNEEADIQMRDDIEIHKGCNGENESTISASDREDTPGALQDEDVPSGSPVKDVNHDSCLLDLKMEGFSLHDIPEDTKAADDKAAFLSEKSNSDVDANSDSQVVYPLGSEMLNNNPVVHPDSLDMHQSKYDPSVWTPAEIEAATGSSGCIVMEHPLKLQSVYREVEDCYGTRGSSGEPSVTSYHRRFFGTVDYIWRSEGLQTSRVLATIPEHAMKWTRGFPTKKWGSDHIALVSELAFIRNDISSPSADVKSPGDEL